MEGSSGPSQGRKTSPPTTEAMGAITLPAHSNTMLSYSALREKEEGRGGGRGLNGELRKRKSRGGGESRVGGGEGRMEGGEGGRMEGRERGKGVATF